MFGGQRKGEHIREAWSRFLTTLYQATFLMVLLRKAGKARRKQRHGETSPSLQAGIWTPNPFTT